MPRKSTLRISQLTVSALVAASIGLAGLPSSADSQNVLTTPPTVLATGVDFQQLVVSGSSNQVFAPGLTLSNDNPSVGDLWLLNESGETDVFEPLSVSDIFDYDGDEDFSEPLGEGFRRVSVSADASKILVQDLYGTTYFKDSTGWSGLAFDSETDIANDTYTSVGSAKITADGKHIFALVSAQQASDPFEFLGSSIWVKNIEAGIAASELAPWVSLGAWTQTGPDEQSLEFELSADGSKIIAYTAGMAMVADVPLAQLTSEQFLPVLKAVPFEPANPWMPTFAASISADGQTMMVISDDRSFATVSVDGGANFSEYDPEMLFGPGYVNYPYPNDHLLATSSRPGPAKVSISADGSTILAMSGEYFAFSKDNAATWSTVWSGGYFPFDVALIGTNEFVLLSETTATSGIRQVTRGTLSATLSSTVPVKEQNGTVVLPSLEFDPAFIQKSGGITMPAPEGEDSGYEIEVGSLNPISLNQDGNPVVPTGVGIYEWGTSGWALANGVNPALPLGLGGDRVQFIEYISGDFAVTMSHADDPDTATQFETSLSESHLDEVDGSLTFSSFPGPEHVGIEAEIANTRLGPFVTNRGGLYVTGFSSMNAYDADAEVLSPLYMSSFGPWEMIQDAGNNVILGDWISLERAVNTVDALPDVTPDANEDLIYAASRQGGIYWANSSTPDTWQSVSLPAEVGSSSIVSFSAGSGGVLGVVVASNPANRGFVSLDNGVSFTEVEAGKAFNLVEVSADGQSIAFFSDYSVSISDGALAEDGSRAFDQIVTTSGYTRNAQFFGASSLMFDKVKYSADPDGGYQNLYVVDINKTVAWTGNFGDEAAPTWGTKIWDPSSAYTPNYLSAGWNQGGLNSWSICETGLSDVNCDIPDLSASEADLGSLNISGQMYLDPCADEFDTLCIEGLSVGSASSEALTAAQVLPEHAPTGGFSWAVQSQPIPGTADTFEIKSSGQPSVWSAEGQPHDGGDTTYSVNVVLQFSYSVSSGLSYPTYAATVLPVNMVTGEQYQRVTADGNYNGFSWSGNDESCAWNDRVVEMVEQVEVSTGICAEKQAFAPNTEVSLSVRLPKEMSGWYKGRVFDPAISTEFFNDAFNTVTVSGVPAERVPFLEDAQITLADTPLASRSLAFSLLGAGGQLISDSSPDTVKFINAVKNGLNDTANAEASIWQFSNLELPSNQCYADLVVEEGAGVIVGMVSTDAMAYSGRPPVYSGGTLKYSVAGMHRYLGGTEVVSGKYSLLVRSDYAECAYGVAPDDFDPGVSVYETSTGVVKTGTTLSSTSFTDAAGVTDWFKMNVSGITFSNPTIAINLTGGQATAPQDTDTGTGGGAVTPVIQLPSEPLNASQPIPAGKTSQILVGGVLLTGVTVQPDLEKKALNLKGTDWNLSVKPGTGTAPAIDENGALIVPPSGSTQLEGGGYQPGSKVAAYLIPVASATTAGLSAKALSASLRLRVLSTPISLGTLDVSSSGVFSGALSTTGVTPGSYALQINGISANGQVRSVSLAAVVLRPPATISALKGWAKRLPGNQAKVYVKNVIGAGKVQITLNGKELAWVNAVDASNPKLRSAAGASYLVRTINLLPGKNRLKIMVDGKLERAVTYSR